MGETEPDEPHSEIFSKDMEQMTQGTTRRGFLALSCLGLLCGGLVTFAGPERSALAAEGEKTAYDFTFTAIDGTELPLSAWKGKSILVVNTASQCGFTDQYEGLQALWQSWQDKGLVVLGVPSNDFGQEFGSEKAIKDFCESMFSVNFPLTERQHVKGDQAHPFFAWTDAQGHGQPRWNFYKYLIGPDGRIVDSWSSMTGPDSDDLVEAVSASLK